MKGIKITFFLEWTELLWFKPNGLGNYLPAVGSGGLGKRKLRDQIKRIAGLVKLIQNKYRHAGQGSKRYLGWERSESLGIYLVNTV